MMPDLQRSRPARSASVLLARPGDRCADAPEMPARMRKDDAAHDALHVELVPLIGQRDPAKLRLAHPGEQGEQTRSPFVQLAPDGLLRWDTSGRDPRVQRMRRLPVERERRVTAERERDEARLPPESERDVERRYGHGPAFRFAGPPPIVLV